MLMTRQRSHTWSCTADRTDILVGVNNSTKVLSLQSNSSFTGTSTISCTVKDREVVGKTATGTFNLVIARENTAPVLYNTGINVNSYPNKTFTYQLIASDSDPQDVQLAYSLNGTTGITINATTGIVSGYTPTAIGETKTVNVQVCDSSTARNKCVEDHSLSQQ